MEGKEDQQGVGPTQPPVAQGEVLEVKIISIGQKGDGVAKFEGFVIIVPGTKVGQVVEVEITKVMQRLAFAEVKKQEE